MSELLFQNPIFPVFFENVHRSHVNVMAKVAIFNVGVFDFAMRFHIVSSREFLAAHGAFMALRPMYIGVVPPIRHRLMATNASIERWKRSRQLNE